MNFDVIVVGGGHAGTEAAAASARKGARTLLVTDDRQAIGAMSCNPAIGGIGKGHLVREVDIFDGLIARAADRAAIHYRMLNRSKGSAVHGPRVQADRKIYRSAIQTMLKSLPNLMIAETHVTELCWAGNRVVGLCTRDGATIRAAAIVLATGTFLNGRMYRGEEQSEGGRVGAPAAERLGAQLHGLGLLMGRLKTGTPPRLDGRTVDWSKLDRQASDREQWTMSPLSTGRELPQLACGLTFTNQRTHEIVEAGFGASPLGSGAIAGRGPRYCPSIEDKVRRFADRDRHQIFLEPEGLDTSTIYPNGISTSLSVDVQTAFVRSIAGLERAEIVQPGYAVEYDYVDPRALDGRLAVRDVEGLFFAGQINGTTGYEEAAAQGLVAGLNAAACAQEASPILFDRSDSYIGVMIDDLTLQGVSEPYRMLTSRAEHRLRLRASNAAVRLGPSALGSGAIGDERCRWLSNRADLKASLAAGNQLNRGSLLEEELRVELEDDARYAPYVARQAAETKRLAADERLSLGEMGSYAGVPGLSAEMIERCNAARPASLAAARRIQGLTPAALAAIALAARRSRTDIRVP